ncbi:unnamed protein product [Prunus brigantina]
MAVHLGSLVLSLVLLVGFAFTNNKAANTDTDDLPIHCDSLNRSSFDALQPGFIFGTTSAAYQYEGAVKEGGRGPSIWDTYTHNHSERIVDGSNGDVTVDQYHRYKEDVVIMKNTGLDAYRFSISWSNLLPNGKLSLKPFVTIFHWDLPQALEDEYGGFLSRNIVDHFRDYAELCFKEFGDRVKHWITMNEPYTVSHHGYAIGCHAPGRCSTWQNLNCTGGNSATEPYLVTHHQLLAHAAVVRLYKDEYQAVQNGSIGITLASHWFEPASEATKDINAAFRSLDFMCMDPLSTGDYPHSMRSLVGERLPKFTEEQSKLLNGSFDFIGINYYTARYSSDASDIIYVHTSYLTDPHVNVTTELNGVPIGPKTSDWLYVYPKGIHDLILYIKEKYNDPIIYITENGVDEFNDPKVSLQEALNDTNRIDYYYRHLCYLQASIKNGAKVKGYFAWSLLDNFEWNYDTLFGLVSSM